MSQNARHRSGPPAADPIFAPTAAPPCPSSKRAHQMKDQRVFFNRELSWLEFNSRVLAESDDERVPLFERLKFLSIFATNLDEFFMVRVANLQAQLSGDVDEVSPDGQTPATQLRALGERAQTLVSEAYNIWGNHLRPALSAVGVSLVQPAELAPEALKALDAHFESNIFPVLTPIAIDPVHPFPHVRNKSINVAVIFERADESPEPAFGVVQVPGTLPRLIRVSLEGGTAAFVALEDVILRHAQRVFPRMKVLSTYAFRVTRNFDVQVDDDEAEDLMRSLQAELRRRERGSAVRLEVSKDAPRESILWLCRELSLDPELCVYVCHGPLFLGALAKLTSEDKRRELKDEPFSPQYVPPFRDSEDFFETIRARDVLLHHPYESFEAVVDFLWQAAEDPNVLAIKQTLYRTGGESPLVRALQRAAELGKQVTAVVELKARFDEESNIRWARALERSGVNVMYGLLGLKTHSKVLLVVRQEGAQLRRYVHLATGNYNQQTARLYEDLSLFTAREDFGEDATSFFNLLTGYSAPERWNRLIVAPLGLHEGILALIAREAEHAKAGRRSGIVAKMNSLVDAEVIKALYLASQAGVPITLLIRGICCLRPQVPELSTNIRVFAVIDRYLEHARIFHFANGGNDEVFMSSADWMPRNFTRRVETMIPVVDEELRRRIIDEIMAPMCADDVKAWELQEDGTYRRRFDPLTSKLRSQERFIEAARERARIPDAYARLGPRRPVPTGVQPDALAKLRRLKRKRRKRRGE